MDGPRQLFLLIYNVFFGFILSVSYGAVSAFALWLVRDRSEVTAYLNAYFVTFNLALSIGLVLATAITVYRTREYVPGIIESTFTEKELRQTEYYECKENYYHLRRTVTFSSSFAIIGFAIFFFARFPMGGAAEYFLVGAGCIQYALGVYVGRKIFHIAHMLRAIDRIHFRKDIFKDDLLSGVSIYVNAISTLTAIMVYVVVRSSYYSPFEYSSIVGTSVKSLMLLPAVIALPVLALFNYYPRVVIRRLYKCSISKTLRTIQRKAVDDELSHFERLTYVLEFDRLSRDELNYRLRMTLADLPMAVTVGIALLSVLTD